MIAQPAEMCVEVMRVVAVDYEERTPVRDLGYLFL